MDKVVRYKKLYPAVDGVENMVLNEDGKVDLPIWLTMLLIHNSGLKSRKKRIVKKRLKREVTKLLQTYIKTQNDSNT